MDALELLTQQHKEAMALFDQIENTEDPKKARPIFNQLKAALQMHEDLEERALYPRMKEDKEFEEDTLEAYQEHHVMDLLLREISELTESSEQFHPKCKVLKENVKHHAEEEEEQKLFPDLRKKWNAAKLAQVGLEMEGLMKQLQQPRKAA
jgi:hypothetical protein